MASSFDTKYSEVPSLEMMEELNSLINSLPEDQISGLMEEEELENSENYSRSEYKYDPEEVACLQQADESDEYQTKKRRRGRKDRDDESVERGGWCHQCHQKATEKIICSRVESKGKVLKRCKNSYCIRCLKKHYGEEVYDINSWICRRCRGLCRCTKCKKKAGSKQVKTGESPSPVGSPGSTPPQMGFDPARNDSDLNRVLMDALLHEEKNFQMQTEKLNEGIYHFNSSVSPPLEKSQKSKKIPNNKRIAILETEKANLTKEIDHLRQRLEVESRKVSKFKEKLQNFVDFTDSEDETEPPSKRRWTTWEDRISATISPLITLELIEQLLHEQRESGMLATSVQQIANSLRMEFPQIDSTVLERTISFRISNEIHQSMHNSSIIEVSRSLYGLRDGLDTSKMTEYLQSVGAVNVDPAFDTNLQLQYYKRSIKMEHYPLKVPEPEDSSNYLTRWIGQPLRKEHNIVYYGGVYVDKIIYRVGDCAFFSAPSKYQQKGYLGRILTLFQDGANKKVECVWYFFPNETHFEKLPNCLQNEVLLSTTTDVNLVGLLYGRAEVCTHNEYKRREQEGQVMQDVFFCRRWYQWNEDIHPFELDEDFIYTSSQSVLIAQLEQQEIVAFNQERKFHNLKHKFKELEAASRYMQKEDRSNKNKRRQKTPKNWPVNFLYSHSNVLDFLPRDLRKTIFSGIIQDVEILPIDDKQTKNSFGLFSTRDLPAGIIIGEYIGVFRALEPQEQCSNPVAFEGEKIVVEIDASEHGNETRFIRNCKDLKLSPNTKLKRVNYGGSYHLLVETVASIKKGEELLIEYGSTNCVQNNSSPPQQASNFKNRSNQREGKVKQLDLQFSPPHCQQPQQPKQLVEVSKPTVQPDENALVQERIQQFQSYHQQLKTSSQTKKTDDGDDIEIDVES